MERIGTVLIRNVLIRSLTTRPILNKIDVDLLDRIKNLQVDSVPVSEKLIAPIANNDDINRHVTRNLTIAKLYRLLTLYQSDEIIWNTYVLSRIFNINQQQLTCMVHSMKLFSQVYYEANMEPTNTIKSNPVFKVKDLKLRV